MTSEARGKRQNSDEMPKIPRKPGTSSGTASAFDGGARPFYMDFGRFLAAVSPDGYPSQGRIAQLIGYDAAVVSKIHSSGKVSQQMALRILVALLYLRRDQLEAINLGLAAGDFHPIPIPGKDVPSHEDHDRLKKGGQSGVRFGVRKARPLTPS